MTWPVHAQPLSQVGVLLLHGKGGAPGRSDSELRRELASQGAIVLSPAMPWQGQRGVPQEYIKTIPEIVQLIDGHLESLRTQGAQKLILMGHSLGANVALAYGAQRPGKLSAMVLLAPGHVPDRFDNQDILRHALQAKQKVEQGTGQDVGSYPDINQGKTAWTRASAASYWSFFNPEGDAAMPKNAAALEASMPVLYVIGTQDPLFRLGPAYIFQRLPVNPKSQYMSVQSDHFNTPNVSSEKILEWVMQLKL